MTGTDFSNHIPAKHERRKFTIERNRITNKEVRELLEINSVDETEYPNWSTEVLIVKKKNGKNACALILQIRIRPNEIIKVVRNGAYRIRTKKDRDISRSWNANHLETHHF